MDRSRIVDMAKSYRQTSCPVARALDVIGERWSILILRDLFLHGPRRFQDFQDSLTGVAPNTLSARLKSLETQGVIETLAGKGCFLKATSSPLKKSARHDRLTAEIDQAIVAAHHLQVPRAEFLTLVKDRLDHFAEQQESHAEKDRP